MYGYTLRLQKTNLTKKMHVLYFLFSIQGNSYCHMIGILQYKMLDKRQYVSTLAVVRTN